MALKLKRKTREPEEIPLASTSDIAFLLIIFFLTASALLEFRGVQLPLPKPDAPPMQVLKENIFRVKLDREGSFYYENEKSRLDELQAKIQRRHRENPELVVVLTVDPQAPSGKVPEFLHRLNQINIVRFSMSMDGKAP